MPPLTEMTCAVTYAASSDTRNDTTAATSSGEPRRFMGTSRSIAFASKRPAVIGVPMMPGATEFTVMPRVATSSASALVAEFRAPLAAA